MRNTIACCLAILAASALAATIVMQCVIGEKASQAADGSTAETKKTTARTANASGPRVARRKPDEHAVVDDIAEIRRRVGIELFSDSSLNSDDGANSNANSAGDFREALIRLVPPSENDAVRANAWVSCESDYARAVFADQSAESDFVSTLNEAGRQLELKASQLDKVKEHERAAHLRGLAGELRKQSSLEQQP